MFITTANIVQHAAAAARPHGDHLDLRLHRGREGRASPGMHLIAKQEKGHGLKPAEFELTDEGLRDIVRYYTREAGVRNLEREIAKLCRKAVTEIVKGKAAKVVVTPENLEEFLGVRRFKYGLAETERPGRRRHRARLDRGGGRPPVDRGAEAARQGADEDHRHARRRDEGVDRRGLVLGAVEGAGPRAEAADVRDDRHPRPRARGGDPEGRAVGGHRDGDLDRLGADRHPGAPRRGDDRRGDAARQRAADRRAEGEAARGAARAASPR